MQWDITGLDIYITTSRKKSKGGKGRGGKRVRKANQKKVILLGTASFRRSLKV